MPQHVAAAQRRAAYSSAPLGPEDQGGFRFPPLDPLDSCFPLETTRGCGPWTRGGIKGAFIYVSLAMCCLEQSSSYCSRCKPLRTIALPPTGVQGFTPGRFKGDMGSLREVRGEIEIPPPPLGPSGAGLSLRTLQRYEHQNQFAYLTQGTPSCLAHKKLRPFFQAQFFDSSIFLQILSSAKKSQNEFFAAYFVGIHAAMVVFQSLPAEA